MYQQGKCCEKKCITERLASVTEPIFAHLELSMEYKHFHIVKFVDKIKRTCHTLEIYHYIYIYIYIYIYTFITQTTDSS